jgi:hypothetical protein
MLKHMLDHIVSKLVLCKGMNVYKYLFKYRSALQFVTILQNALNHSAAIGMDAELINVLSHWLNHEVDDLCRHFLNAFLDNMVSILVINAFDNRVFEFRDKKLLLVK